MRAPLLVLAVFAIAAALIAWSRWLSRRRWAAAGNLLLGVGSALLVAIGWPIVRHLETYEIARHGQAIASLYVEKIGTQRQRVTLTRLPSGRMQVFDLGGNEWRLVVRELESTPLAESLGFARRYRIESLDSRDSSTPTPSAPAVVDLAEARGFDVWSRAVAGSPWFMLVTPREYLLPWEPLADRERFRIYFDGDELAAERPGVAALAGEAAKR